MPFTRSLLLLAVLFGITIPAHADPAASVKPRQPNILLCIADDWGWPHAGVCGDEVVETPTFDRLAREGVLFHHAFISSPSCTPSRNALITGQQFYRLQAGANLWTTLDARHPNFMFLLRETGYAIGHWRKAWGPGLFAMGGYDEHPCGPESTFEAFMADRDTDKPFCFWFGTSDPHRGYTRGSGARHGIEVDKVQVPGFYPDTTEIRSDIADYYFEVQRWDSDVGKAIALLEKAGELDNTIIVMSGDHGMPFPRCKANLYDWGARVPLAIRWGDEVTPARSVSDFVSLTDLAPTFLDAAGAEVPAEMTGQSLLPLLRSGSDGRVERSRDFMVYGRERHTPAQQKPSMDGYPARAIRTDKWLLILNLEHDRWPAGVPQDATHSQRSYTDCDGGPTKSVIVAMQHDPVNKRFYELCFARRPAVELYDCEQDPDQLRNLADQPELADTIESLSSRLTDYLAATDDPRYTDLPVHVDTYPYQRKDPAKHKAHDPTQSQQE